MKETNPKGDESRAKRCPFLNKGAVSPDICLEKDESRAKRRQFLENGGRFALDLSLYPEKDKSRATRHPSLNGGRFALDLSLYPEKDKFRATRRPFLQKGAVSP